MFLKKIRVRVTDIDQFKSVFDCDFVSTSQVIHQKLYQVKEVTRLKSCLVEDASFVHECELIFIDLSIKILIDFPDPLIDFRFAERETELSQYSDHILLVNRKATLKEMYGFLLKLSLSPLLLLTLSPQTLMNVFLSLSASMF